MDAPDVPTESYFDSENHDRGKFNSHKKELHERLISSMSVSAADNFNEHQLREEIRQAADDFCRNNYSLLSYDEKENLINEVLDETFGLGPLERLMSDATITDILINGPEFVYVERGGKIELTSVSFQDNRHLVHIVQRIVGRVGRRLDEMNPMVDARLPDGSRINAVIPPLALDGALVSIRRFGQIPLRMDNLIDNESVTPDMAEFLSACIQARMNLLISGGTGSGKTTLLNSLSAFIPHGERIITIEDAAELTIQQPHVGRLETRPANTEGNGEVTTRHLVRNALRMRPDRIVIGECRGPEALDMLQAMNTGHEGSMTTIHANDTRDALSRLEMMVSLAGVDLPISIIRKQIVSAIRIIVQVARDRGGRRRVVKISEITNLEGDVISMHDLFGFKQIGIRNDGVSEGSFYCSGIRPACLDQLSAAGCTLSTDLFAEHD